MSDVIVSLQEEKTATGFNHSLIFDIGSASAFSLFFFKRVWMVVGCLMFDLPKMFCLFLKVSRTPTTLKLIGCNPEHLGKKIA